MVQLGANNRKQLRLKAAAQTHLVPLEISETVLSGIRRYLPASTDIRRFEVEDEED